MQPIDAIELNVLCLPNHFGEMRPLEISGLKGRVGPISGSDISFVTAARLDEDNQDTAIARVVDLFRAERKEFGWFVTPASTPAGLPQALTRAGLRLEVEAAGMELVDFSATDCDPPADVEIVRCSIADQADVVAVVTNGYGAPPPVAEFHARHWLHPGSRSSIEVYLARNRATREPMALGVLLFMLDTPYAFLWSGSTLPAYRGRGVYKSLISHRLARARENRATSVLVLATRNGSMPICSRFGFREICPLDLYSWKPGS